MELAMLADDHIVSCDIHDNGKKVAELFDKYNLRALPVVDDGKEAGRRDLRGAGDRAVADESFEMRGEDSSLAMKPERRHAKGAFCAPIPATIREMRDR